MTDHLYKIGDHVQVTGRIIRRSASLQNLPIYRVQLPDTDGDGDMGVTLYETEIDGKVTPPIKKGSRVFHIGRYGTVHAVSEDHAMIKWDNGPDFAVRHIKDLAS